MFEKLKDFSSNRFLRKTVLLVIRTCKVYNFAWRQIAGVAGGNVSASKVLAEKPRSRAEKQEGFSRACGAHSFAAKTPARAKQFR